MRGVAFGPAPSRVFRAEHLLRPRRLWLSLIKAEIPDALVLPTGTGKTSAIIVYVLALAHGAEIRHPSFPF
jgi:hypothetical protein